ncbi:5315_t:CDS:2 [Dentiscutata erythropus]|uniref:5315_t:CDS:1 n=1 Tax=Dentiscutata erythropus TaxID=1348616 RepID=A0A9N9FZE7_9GLOM|nr:5315_t:CDS:2 [Dentiscutata erythropus]
MDEFHLAQQYGAKTGDRAEGRHTYQNSLLGPQPLTFQKQRRCKPGGMTEDFEKIVYLRERKHIFFRYRIYLPVIDVYAQFTALFWHNYDWESLQTF